MSPRLLVWLDMGAEFLIIPFELTNAPAMFCNLMNDVLFNFLDSFMVVYLDDIIIYSQTP